MRVPQTPGLWEHISIPTEFTVVVDNFGVNYIEEHMQNLISALKEHFTIAADSTGGMNCDITLKWGYERRILDFSIPDYINKVLQQYKYEKSKLHQVCSYPVEPKKCCRLAQAPIPPDTSRHASHEETKRVQPVMGSIQYYIQAVDSMCLMLLLTIATEQATATVHTIKTTEQLSDAYGLKSRCNNEILCFSNDIKCSLR